MGYIVEMARRCQSQGLDVMKIGVVSSSQIKDLRDNGFKWIKVRQKGFTTSPFKYSIEVDLRDKN